MKQPRMKQPRMKQSSLIPDPTSPASTTPATCDAQTLLPALQKLVRSLEDDLRRRCQEVPELATFVEQQYETAREAERTGVARAEFRDQLVTQAAVAWVLAVVFVRFLEDNQLLDGSSGKVRWIAGSDLQLLQLARDHERVYFRDQPHHGEREYLLHVFTQVGSLPGLARLFDRRHSLLWDLGPSADGARDLLEAMRRRNDDEHGTVALSFVSPGLDTRFLGDLYQDLSESVRKRYALLQTPHFVEQFLLERTLVPAIDKWGAETVRLIDPACGSGHFLLGAFHHLLPLHRNLTPGDNPRLIAQRVLHQVAGVDLNPYAAAIARFRLLVAALVACGIEQLAGAPDFEVQVASGDALLHGKRPPTRQQTGDLFGLGEGGTPALDSYLASEDEVLARELLEQRYHVVVGNPPYITVKDPGLRDLYRERYKDSCKGKYSLVCPFLERCFDLAARDGFVAVIVANSFMKRQFGKPLIEKVLPRWDLTHVLDASGAYIPGHGTPTVILVARARAPQLESVRAVMGIRGEPSTPAEPARGRVWKALVGQIDVAGSESEWMSAEDLDRANLSKHPWSLQGGGALQIFESVNKQSSTSLGQLTRAVGVMALAGNDDVFIAISHKSLTRMGLSSTAILPLVSGDAVRDWELAERSFIIYPHNQQGHFRELPSAERHFWTYRTELRNYIFFGGNREQRGLNWRELGAVQKDKLEPPLSIGFAFVATHNHFVLDRGGKVFKQTAPVIKLPPDASEEAHLELLGLLNSSTACFWMKQVFFDKGLGDEAWEPRYEHDSTKLQQFPLPAERPLEPARTLDALGQELLQHTPAAVCTRQVPTRQALDDARVQQRDIRRRMIAWQEELDWQAYRLYGLLDDDLTYSGSNYAGQLGRERQTGEEELPRIDLPGIELGTRAFEIVLARRMAAGEVETRWFERHGSTPTTELPAGWPEAYRRLVTARIERIRDPAQLGQKAIQLLERPEYKRRWSADSWDDEEREALRQWLLDRLEDRAIWFVDTRPQVRTVAQLADLLRADPDARQVAALYRGRDDFRFSQLVAELVEAEGVPYLARQRYKPSGLRKRQVWEDVWQLQRREDAGERDLDIPSPDIPFPDIPVPPKYARGDFARASYWSLRGKLDVPKERFVLYPGAERTSDSTAVVGWAGWDHRQRAEALAGHYVQLRSEEGTDPERLLPLLDGLEELLPWLRQWHNEVDPEYGQSMAQFFTDFLSGERSRLADAGH